MQRTRLSGHYEEVRLVSLELGGDPRKVSPRLLDRPPVALKQIGLNFEAIAVNNASRLSGRDGRPTRAQSHRLPSEFRSDRSADGLHRSR